MPFLAHVLIIECKNNGFYSYRKFFLLLLQKNNNVMKLKKFILFLLMLSLMSPIVAARTIEVKMSQCEKPLLENVRDIVSQATSNDVIVLNFDKAGTYELDGSIKFRCNTIIKGVDSKKTRVVLKEGFSNGKSKMLDDTFLAMHGSSTKKIKVEIKDIRFELANHKGTLWETAPKHIIKICYGNGIIVDNASFWSTDAVITHVDLRDCSNALVQNCLFENYNNCLMGGCLWSRGYQENITVKNNTFWKYGNDEPLAIWAGGDKKATLIKNIIIDGNNFYYENKTKCKKIISIDVLINFAHYEDELVSHKCTVGDITFKNNTITNNAQSKRSLWFHFDNTATLEGTIEVANNTIRNTSKCQVSDGYMTDIIIDTGSENRGDFKISDNNVYNEAQILCDGKHSGYTFLGMNNGNVTMTNNYIQSDYPITFVWGHGGYNTLNLFNNVVSELSKMAMFNSSKKLEKIVINASNNEFTGDTRIYSNNIDELELNFTNNIFNSSNPHVFLQEGAPVTSIIFDGNTVNALNRNGTLFANYSGKPYKFTRLQVTNNIFNGVTKKSIDDSFMKNVTKKNIQNNIYK